MRFTFAFPSFLFALVLSSSSPASFDAREASIESIHTALYGGTYTCRQIVEGFIARIEKFNPILNALVALNPHALHYADEYDLLLRAGNATGKLFCIPVLLKDNFDAFDMPTTGSSVAFADYWPNKDAPSVAAIRSAGSIILGKTNLHELALEGLSVSSIGGQTINPYDHTRTPGGSSGGSGASIAASFAVWATGTDTVNSLRSPASANSLCSLRPTRGLISRAGVLPVSKWQDTVGPIARTVKDVAAALTVMASVGFDPKDDITAIRAPETLGIDFTTALTGGSFEGKRIGVLEGFFNRTMSEETTPVNLAMNKVFSKLKDAGATLIHINDTFYDADNISAKWDVQAYEFAEALDRYLSRGHVTGIFPKTTEEYYASKKFIVTPGTRQFVNNALAWNTGNVSYAVRIFEIENVLTRRLHETFIEHHLDVIIYPEQKNLVVKRGSPSQYGRNGILAALTGFPVSAIPAGFSEPTEQAPIGVPIGMEVLGRPYTEASLLNMAYMIETLLRVRKMPEATKEPVNNEGYNTVPVITPNRENIPGEYKLGDISIL